MRVAHRLSRLQARLDAAQMEITAGAYIRRSLMTGAVLGGGLGLLLGAPALIPAGMGAGFALTWTALEAARDRRQVQYARMLAQACDVIRNSYAVKPSLQKALEAAAAYTQPPVQADFGELLIGYLQGEFEAALERMAERRRSIVFDGVANALLRAERAGAGVTDMLGRLAQTTRENAAAFEDAIVLQTTARSNVAWGTYGPWGVFAVFRVLTLALSLTSAAGAFGGLTTFFSSPAGNAMALTAGLISMASYFYCHRLAQRGLVTRRGPRVPALSDPIGPAQAKTEQLATPGAPLRGQRPLASLETRGGG